MGSLGSMLPSCGYLLVQVLEITMEADKPTGEVIIHDGEFFVKATVDKRYVPELEKRRWGRYSIIQVKGTSGLHNELVIVGFLSFCLFVCLNCAIISPRTSSALLHLSS